jgi:hypothetical protein
MARQSKSVTAASAAPVTPVTPVAAEPKQRKTKAIGASATHLNAAPAPVVETPSSTPVPVVETPAAVEETVTLSTKLASYSAKIQEVCSLAASLKAEYKLLEKSIQKELKAAAKSGGRKRKEGVVRKASGFFTPSGISEDMLKFLGKEPGTIMSRNEVGKEINAYINAHNLKDPANGRQINADAKLAKLLKLAKGDVLTYFNLQRYLKIHFFKVAPPAAVATA